MNSSFRHAFILSAPRSGSTLLRVSLNKIPNIVSPPETYFFKFYQSNLHLDPLKQKDRIEIGEKFVADNNHLNHRKLYNPSIFKERVNSEAKNWQDIFHILIQCYCLQAGKDLEEGMIIIEKTPIHIEYQKEILQLFPDSYFIYLVRDPRAVVASLKSCSWNTSSVNRNSFYWSHTIKMIRRREKSVVIKYEDLVDSTAKEMNRIGKLLDIEITENQIQQDPINEGRESTDLKNINSFKKIESSFKTKWKALLSEVDHDQEKIEAICHLEMTTLDYIPEFGPNQFLFYYVTFQEWSRKNISLRILRKLL